VIIGGPF